MFLYRICGLSGSKNVEDSQGKPPEKTEKEKIQESVDFLNENQIQKRYIYIIYIHVYILMPN